MEMTRNILSYVAEGAVILAGAAALICAAWYII